jgi:hypothetical protein
MKSYDSKMKKKIFRKTVSDEVAKNAEIYDLALLWTLHKNKRTRLGAKGLEQIHSDFVETYGDMRERYYCEGDEEKFGSRTDAYVIKQKLKDIGFDYDEITGQMVEGSEEK